MITSWESVFAVPAGVAGGQIGTFLSIAGALPALGSADAVALQTEISINGGAFAPLPSLILAAAHNGNFVALGGQGGVILYGPGDASFTGLAIDNLAAFGALGGANITAISTLTALADPASIDSIMADPTLAAQLGGLPQFTLASGAGQVPEPESINLLAVGLAGFAMYARRRRLLRPGRL
jgi:hypothetical protein